MKAEALRDLKFPSPPVLVIAGPTASGKSALALALAQAFQQAGRAAEILCADSVTVYRGLEIGAAKPSATDRALIPHHLLDLAQAEEDFTAGDFVRHALAVLSSLHSQGKIPILAGGTGFYLRALLRGMASNEEQDPAKAAAIKARLEARAETEGWAVLHSELIAKDPGSLPTIHPNDHYRILRALQAMELYQKPWSELNRAARAAGWRFPGTRFFCLDIDRPLLAQRINIRTHAMLEADLLEEVSGLLAAGISPQAKSLQSVGYRECLDTLSGLESRETLAERIQQSTMRLAKAQRTWFRGEKGVEWLQPDYFSSLLAALQSSFAS
jgi:tRNA dimethylallyltransferase